MSDTPETDKAERMAFSGEYMVPTEFARKLEDQRNSWEQTAAHYLDGMHYYRGLVEQIGKIIGIESYVQDDGGIVDSVLCAKVPELVVDLKRERDEARNAVVGWENKWKCAIEMAAKAEIERDEAKEKYRSAVINWQIECYKLRREREALIEAAKAVVERWDQPSWKDAEPTAAVIYRLRNAVQEITGEVET